MKPQIRSWMRAFIPLLLYFSVWALIRPPFQTPDEYSHAYKAYSVSRTPWLAPDVWVAAYRRFVNPLAQDPVLNALSGHTVPFLSRSEIARLKGVGWPAAPGWAVEKQPSSAFNYPTLYYLPVFAIGQGATEILALTPYQSSFAYRLATVLLAALLWTWVYRVLRQETPHAVPVFLVVLLNPMLAFMSSGINPDAWLYPLSALAMLYSFRLFFTRDAGGWGTWASVSACALTKSAALLLYPTLAVLVGLLYFMRERTRLLRAAGWFALSALFVYLLFYAWAAPAAAALAAQGLKGISLSVGQFLARERFGFLWVSYWGNLGWLDYRLPDGYYSVLNYLLLGNLAWVLLHRRSWLEHPLAWYAASFAVVFSLGSFALEYRLLPITGWVLQGRYFLPVSLGFAMLAAHDGRLAKWALVIFLVVFNAAFMRQTVVRYYDGDWARLWSALPFTAAPGPSASSQRQLQIVPVMSVPAAVRLGAVDDVGVERNEVVIRGWAPFQDGVAGQVLTVHTDHAPSSQVLEVQRRPDVVAALRSHAYLKSGFSITLTYPDAAAAQQAAADPLCVTASDVRGTVFSLVSNNADCAVKPDGR